MLFRSPEWPAALRRMVWIECTGVPGALGVTANIGARRGGWRVADDAVDDAMIQVLSAAWDAPRDDANSSSLWSTMRTMGREKGGRWGNVGGGQKRARANGDA